MKWLVLVHVLSVIIGYGPTFLGHVFFRNRQTVADFKQSVGMMKYLEPFPKFGGTLAVLSGLLLVFLSGWRFADFWIWSSLSIFVIAQIIIIAMITPLYNKVGPCLKELKADESELLPDPLKSIVLRINRLSYVISSLLIIIIVMMVIKPML